MKHLGDITKINGAAVTPVNVICGGSPCQDLSIAGKRAGLAGERSGLFMEQIRIIKEMRANERKLHSDWPVELIRPRYMVWENVVGAFSSNNGEDFRAVLEETVRIIDPCAVIPRPENGRWSYAGCIMGDGYSVAWRTHDAQYWGVPQRRRRISLVADFAGSTAPEILFECESVSGNLEQGEQTWQGIAKDAQGSTTESSGNGDVYCLQANGIGRKPENGCEGKGWRQGAAYTLNTIDIPSVAYGFDPQRKAEATGFMKEKAASIVIGTNPGYHNGVVTYAQLRSDNLVESDIATTISARDYKSSTDLVLFTENKDE